MGESMTDRHDLLALAADLDALRAEAVSLGVPRALVDRIDLTIRVIPVIEAARTVTSN
jgi:hypothetical protein